MENVQRINGMLLDSRRDRFRFRYERLGKTQLKWITFYKNGISLLRCIWWHRSWKSCLKIHDWDLSPRSQMFLWLLNDDGKYSFWNIFFIDRYIYSRSIGETLTVYCNWFNRICKIKSWMGNKMDWIREQLCSKASCICMCWRNLLFRKLLCNFLVEKKRINAWLDIFKWID